MAITWTRIDPSSPKAAVQGRIVPRPSVWASDAGYQVAVVDVLDRRKGWALWRRAKGSGFTRVLPRLHLGSADEARLVAELELRRRRLIAGLPARLTVVGLRLARPLLSRLPLAAGALALAPRLRPADARRLELLARYFHALTETLDGEAG